MKRALAAIVATVAGLVLLLGFKTHSARQSLQPAVAATASSPPAPQTSAPTTAQPTATPSSSGPPAKKPSAPATSAPPQTRAVTGSSIRTRYGNVQVQVKFTGAQITDVVPVRLPDSNDVDYRS
jgi:hypothetical protein